MSVQIERRVCSPVCKLIVSRESAQIGDIEAEKKGGATCRKMRRKAAATRATARAAPRVRCFSNAAAALIRVKSGRFDGVVIKTSSHWTRLQVQSGGSGGGDARRIRTKAGRQAATRIVTGERRLDEVRK